MKKRILLAICCLSFSMMLSACGKKDENTSATSLTSVSEATTKETSSTFSQVSNESSMAPEVTSSATKTQSEEKNITENNSVNAINELLKRSREYYQGHIGYSKRIRYGNNDMQIFQDRDGNTKTIFTSPKKREVYLIVEGNKAKHYFQLKKGQWFYEPASVPEKPKNNVPFEINEKAANYLTIKKENNAYVMSGTIPIKYLNPSSDAASLKHDNSNVTLKYVFDAKDYHIKEYTLDLTQAIMERAKKANKKAPSTKQFYSIMEIKNFDNKIVLPKESKNAKYIDLKKTLKSVTKQLDKLDQQKKGKN